MDSSMPSIERAARILTADMNHIGKGYRDNHSSSTYI